MLIYKGRLEDDLVQELAIYFLKDMKLRVLYVIQCDQSILSKSIEISGIKNLEIEDTPKQILGLRTFQSKS